MQSELKNLQAEFENEIWLYIDGTLSDERKKFWDEQMNAYPELKYFFMETTKTLFLYDEHTEYDITDAEFEKSIAKVSSGNKLTKFLAELFSFKKRTNGDAISFPKIAFGSALVVASIILFLLSNNPNPVKSISQDLLEWNPRSFNQRISLVNESISTMKEEDIRQYEKLKNADTKWNSNANSINNKIDRLKKDLNNF